jgi:choline dehydrogenase-like flavoprotein
MNYAVGGNTKIYSAALMRMRDRDFEAVEYQKGISPEWCVKADEFEPYYTEAETLYQVHGQTNDNPTEPTHSQAYPFPAIAHQSQIQDVATALENRGNGAPVWYVCLWRRSPNFRPRSLLSRPRFR